MRRLEAVAGDVHNHAGRWRAVGGGGRDDEVRSRGRHMRAAAASLMVVGRGTGTTQQATDCAGGSGCGSRQAEARQAGSGSSPISRHVKVTLGTSARMQTSTTAA